MADGSASGEGDDGDDGDGDQADQAGSRTEHKEEAGSGTEHKEEHVTTPELTGVERIDYEVSFDEGDTAMEMLGREEDWEPNPFASAGGPW
jgi:hypothetical protein